MNNSHPEPVDEQLDRLNSALQLVLRDITEGSTTSRRAASRLSMAQSDLWNEDSSSDLSDSAILKESLETQLEALLQEQDRHKMIIEDLCARETRRQITLDSPSVPISTLISRLERVKNGESLEIHLGKYNFYLINSADNVTLSYLSEKSDKDRINHLEQQIDRLRKSDAKPNNRLEACPACGVDPNSLEKEIRIQIKLEYQKLKNQGLEKEKKNLETQLEELDNMKENYLIKCQQMLKTADIMQKKIIELEKSEIELAKRKSAFEKKNRTGRIECFTQKTRWIILERLYLVLVSTHKKT